MRLLFSALDALGGIATKLELNAFGVRDEEIDLAAWYGRHLIRVRNGRFARPDEHPEVLRAWRVGGRLTCISAIAFHQGEPSPPALHVEVRANSPRLHDPDHRRRLLDVNAAVVVHWPRRPSPGTRRAVSLEHAEWIAAACGVRAGPTGQAAARVCASRIV